MSCVSPNPSEASNGCSESKDNLKHFYRVFGFTVASSIPLPPLIPASGSADVVINFGDVPDRLEDHIIDNEYWQVSRDHILVPIRNAFRFHIHHGKEIVIERGTGCRDDELVVYLLGLGMGCLLLQRKVLPLHASVVVADQRAIVLMGRSGAGKSTLSAAFCERGSKFLCDDVAAVDLGAGSQPLVHPGYPQRKLWKESLDMMQICPQSQNLSPIMDGNEKYAVPDPDRFLDRPAPIAGIYEIVRSSDQPMAITPLRGAEKLRCVMGNTYGAFLAYGLNQCDHYMDSCFEIASRVRVARLIRPETGTSPEELAAYIEQDLIQSIQ